jgi:hypothetical protein
MINYRSRKVGGVYYRHRNITTATCTGIMTALVFADGVHPRVRSQGERQFAARYGVLERAERVGMRVVRVVGIVAMSVIRNIKRPPFQFTIGVTSGTRDAAFVTRELLRFRSRQAATATVRKVLRPCNSCEAIRICRSGIGPCN